MADMDTETTIRLSEIFGHYTCSVEQIRERSRARYTEAIENQLYEKIRHKNTEVFIKMLDYSSINCLRKFNILMGRGEYRDVYASSGPWCYCGDLCFVCDKKREDLKKDAIKKVEQFEKDMISNPHSMYRQFIENANPEDRVDSSLLYTDYFNMFNSCDTR